MNSLFRNFRMFIISVKQWQHLYKEDEVFERRVEVSFLLKLHDCVKVLMIYMSINSEQTLQNSLGHRHEVLGEGNTWIWM